MIGALRYTFSTTTVCNKSPKKVQARMYAQEATVAVLLASAGLHIYTGGQQRREQLEGEPDAQLQEYQKSK